MIELLKRRRTRKAAKEMLRHAKHLRNMRGDLMSEADTGRIESAEQTVREALRLGVVDRVDEATGALHEVLSQLTPSRRLGSFGENVEIVVVAIVVAMGFRAYFFQPFKIPTGSMQPTLFGIKSEVNGHPTLLDRVPLKYAKWIVTGQMTHVIKAKTGGTLYDLQSYGRPSLPNNPSRARIHVGAQKISVPRMTEFSTSSRSSQAKSTSMSGGSVRPGFKKRSKYRLCLRGQTLVISRQ